MDYTKPAVKVFVSQVLSAPSFKDVQIFHKLGNFVFQRVWLQVGVVMPQSVSLFLEAARNVKVLLFCRLFLSVVINTSMCVRAH